MVVLWVLLACSPTPFVDGAAPSPVDSGGSERPTDTTSTTDDTGSTADTSPTVDSGLECLVGSPCDPLPIAALPFFAEGDTSMSEVRHLDRYDCGPSDEGGAEVWYLLDATPGLLVASVSEVAGDGIDVDVHILTGTTADSCLARDDATAEAFVEEGPVYVVVDTWRDDSGQEYPGPYSLSVDLVPTDGDCPADMVSIDTACIDRFEAHLEGQDPFLVATGGVASNALGSIPQGYISGEVAEGACLAAGKRLCTSDEWLRACEGPSGRVYPYGDVYQPGACNEGRATHPVIEVFGSGATFSSTELNDPRLNQLPDSLAPSGDFAECVSEDGVYDLHGNLHEWVADASGVFRGGFYVDASINGTGCSYRTTAHSFDYHDYSTGFRCCTDLAP